MGIPDHLICLCKTCKQVKKQQLEIDMEQQTVTKLVKEYIKAVYCHPAYVTYAEYIMWNTRLDKAQAGIKIAGRNINNLTYADDTILTVESKEELKSLLMKVKKEREKAGLKLNIQKTKIMASSLINSWQINGETMGTVTYFILGGFKITADGNYSKWKTLTPWKKTMTNLDNILKSRDITLPTKVHILKAMAFSLVIFDMRVGP